MSILRIDIEWGAHGVLNNPKIFCKNFISLQDRNLAPKTSCGRGTIFAWGAQVRAYMEGCVFLCGTVALGCDLWPLPFFEA
jgi:hypothetical protein